MIFGDTGAAAKEPPKDLVKEGTDAGFMADVIEESRKQPVIVDFWAPWCGPCRQLGPTIEKVVKQAAGAVKLVKIDIDKHPAYADQLRVQSIPAVFAFKDGRPVDGFMGALPESQVKAFIDRLAGPPEPSDIDQLMSLAQESMSLNDIGGAAQAYAQILQMDPDNVKAIAGLARCYMMGGDAQNAAELVKMAPADAKDADLDSVRAALKLFQDAPKDVAALQQAVSANPGDHAARYDYARGLAGQGRMGDAVDQLLSIIQADREWNGGAARTLLLQIFDAAGQGAELTKTGRRRLSSILFS